ncbi:MAG: tetratricopeptide repeat protein [Betaproteobacteria bacterium]
MTSPPSDPLLLPNRDAQAAQAALPQLRAALEARPRDPVCWRDYIEALTQANMIVAAQQMLAQAQRRGIVLANAEALLSRLAEIETSLAMQFSHLATLFSKSRFSEMEQAARELCAQHPDNGLAWKALGTALAAQGREADAIVPMEEAVSLLPDDVEAHVSLGIALRDLGRLDDAAAIYRRALQLDSHSYPAMAGLVRVLHAQGCLPEAEALARETVAQHPDIAEGYYDLATLQSGQFRFTEAEAGFRAALKLKPDYVAAMNNLGTLLIDTGRFSEAETILRRARSEDPNAANVLCNLSGALNGQHRHAEADACLDQAITLKPLDTRAFSALLFSLNYGARHTPGYRLERAREYGAAVKVDTPFTRWYCDQAHSSTCLRVGIVSGDLGNHPVGYFLESLVTNIDPARIELYAYPTLHKDDALSARIKPAFAAWRPITGIGDRAAAQRIHDDGIHVLIDLSGHTAGNRLPLFAYKPAPVQVSWLGYFATTGVAEMDYLIADHTGVSESQHTQFTETIHYLPETRLCFTPPADAPAIAASPASRNGFVTFGCFQNLSKVGDDVLATWAKILAAIPDARLRMQCRELGHESSRTLLLERMRACGMPLERISLHGRVGRADYLATYAEVDLLLDTFPYPGGTTTCEALWMGVPTLTLAPQDGTLLARQGASLLTASGMAEWIAEDADTYVQCAIEFARDKETLAHSRAGLRERVKQSALFDAPRFARDMENALCEIWRTRCAKCGRTAIPQ